MAKFLINNNIFAIRGVRHFASGRQQATSDDRRLILAPFLEARLERLDGRRQNKDADCLWIMTAHLARALPVDLENDVVACSEGAFYRLARRAVEIAVDLGPFKHPVLLAQGEEFLLADEQIVTLVLLPGTGRAGRARDGQHE